MLQITTACKMGINDSHNAELCEKITVKHTQIYDKRVRQYFGQNSENRKMLQHAACISKVSKRKFKQIGDILHTNRMKISCKYSTLHILLIYYYLVINILYRVYKS